MIGMAKGMATTLRFFLRPAETVQYPKVRRTLPERSRTMFALPLDSSGKPECKGCGVCAKSCRDAAIQMETAKNPDGSGRILLSYSVDLGLCMYCGICVENCPSDGVKFIGDYERATADKDQTIIRLWDVPEDQRPAEPPAAAADGGEAS